MQQLHSYIIELSAAQTSAGPYNVDFRLPSVVERYVQAAPTGTTTIKVLANPIPYNVGQNQAVRLKPSPEHQTDYNQRVSAAFDNAWTTVATFTSASTAGVIIDSPFACFKIEKAGSANACTVFGIL